MPASCTSAHFSRSESSIRKRLFAVHASIFKSRYTGKEKIRSQTALSCSCAERAALSVFSWSRLSTVGISFAMRRSSSASTSPSMFKMSVEHCPSGKVLPFINTSPFPKRAEKQSNESAIVLLPPVSDEDLEFPRSSPSLLKYNFLSVSLTVPDKENKINRKEVIK
ncbi:hypothetical protein SDC9_125856 [bioreactor metagenome]|uniref:Uncharacterized protein n=1 Tax=bioreactor metagenome TaxID=1076179 RepID=A0A645CPK6_9ZZZZ